MEQDDDQLSLIQSLAIEAEEAGGPDLDPAAPDVESETSAGTDPAPNAEPWRPFRGFGWLAVVGVVAAVGAAGYQGLLDLRAAQERKTELEEAIGSTQVRIDRLQGEIESLESDPEVIERIAREQLGMVAPGDTVILLPSSDARN